MDWSSGMLGGDKILPALTCDVKSGTNDLEGINFVDSTLNH